METHKPEVESTPPPPPSIPPEAAKDLVAAINALDDIAKTREARIEMKNQKGFFSYGYSSLADVLEHTRAVLREHNWAARQELSNPGRSEISCTTHLIHASGHVIVTAPFTLPYSGGPQEAGSAATYARRYSLMAALGIASSDDDDDGAKATNAIRNERNQQRRGNNNQQRQPDPEPEQEHPNQERAQAVWDQITKKLDDDSKIAMSEWKGRHPLTFGSLIEDEGWLNAVEAWIDERLATPPTEIEIDLTDVIDEPAGMEPDDTPDTAPEPNPFPVDEPDEAAAQHDSIGNEPGAS